MLSTWILIVTSTHKIHSSLVRTLKIKPPVSLHTFILFPKMFWSPAAAQKCMSSCLSYKIQNNLFLGENLGDYHLKMKFGVPIDFLFLLTVFELSHGTHKAACNMCYPAS